MALDDSTAVRLNLDSVAAVVPGPDVADLVAVGVVEDGESVATAQTDEGVADLAVVRRLTTRAVDQDAGRLAFGDPEVVEPELLIDDLDAVARGRVVGLVSVQGEVVDRAELILDEDHVHVGRVREEESETTGP